MLRNLVKFNRRHPSIFFQKNLTIYSFGEEKSLPPRSIYSEDKLTMSAIRRYRTRVQCGFRIISPDLASSMMSLGKILIELNNQNAFLLYSLIHPRDCISELEIGYITESIAKLCKNAPQGIYKADIFCELNKMMSKRTRTITDPTFSYIEIKKTGNNADLDNMDMKIVETSPAIDLHTPKERRFFGLFRPEKARQGYYAPRLLNTYRNRGSRHA